MKLALILTAGVLASNYAHATCSIPIVEYQLDTKEQFYISELRPEYTAPAWRPDTIYQEGDRVKHNGAIFEARWWSQNEEPNSDWRSWHMTPNGLPLWLPGRAYEAGESALYSKHVWKAEHWTLGDRPAESASWQINQNAEALRTMAFTYSLVKCFNRQEYHISNPPAGWQGPAYELNVSEKYRLGFETVEATELPAHRWATFVDDQMIASGELGAVIDGQACTDNASCNELLVGQLARIRYHHIDYASQYRTYLLNPPHTSPRLPRKPLKGYVEICHKDNYCRRHMFEHEVTLPGSEALPGA